MLFCVAPTPALRAPSRAPAPGDGPGTRRSRSVNLGVLAEKETSSEDPRPPFGMTICPEETQRRFSSPLLLRAPRSPVHLPLSPEAIGAGRDWTRTHTRGPLCRIPCAVLSACPPSPPFSVPTGPVSALSRGQGRTISQRLGGGAKVAGVGGGGDSGFEEPLIPKW